MKSKGKKERTFVGIMPCLLSADGGRFVCNCALWRAVGDVEKT